MISIGARPCRWVIPGVESGGFPIAAGQLFAAFIASISKRSSKILNEEVDKKLADASFQCTKCHYNLGREKPPKSHLDATGR